MASPFTRYISGGIRRMYAGFYDTDGLFSGGELTLADGEDSGMIRVWAAKTLSYTRPGRERTDQSGDDIHQGFLSFPSLERLTMDLALGVQDMDNEAAFQDILVYADDMQSWLLLGAQVEELPAICAIVNSKAKKKVFGQSMTKGVEIHMIPSCEFDPTGPSSLNQREVRDSGYAIACDQVTAWPWGKAFADSASNEGALNAFAARSTSSWDMCMHAFQRDGIADTFQLDHVPAGVGAAYIEAWEYTRGTGLWAQLDYTTGFTIDAAGLVTLAAVGTATNRIVVKYFHL